MKSRSDVHSYLSVLLLTMTLAACGDGDLHVDGAGDDAGSPGPDVGTLDSGLSLPDAARPDTGADVDGGTMDVGVDTEPWPNAGWIGGACADASHCDYDDAICLTDGHPGGQCSLPCDQFCPDREGNSVTFCVEKEGAGHCVSRCDHEVFPTTGCREGYRCQIVERYGDPGTQQAACLPDDGSSNPNATTACLRELDALGVLWAPWDYSTQYDDGLACTIDDPIRVSSPVNGVEYRYYNQETPGTMPMACELAMALHRLGDVLADFNVDTVLHIGTFNCRKIGGTSRLSQHSFGLAIDIWGFEDANGVDYILERDWEHDTENPQGMKAQLLYDVAWRMHDQKIFNIVLTPNFNSAHDNHFHVDLTEGSNFIGASEFPEYWIGDDRDLCPGWE